jgi:hypothetical protein
MEMETEKSTEICLQPQSTVMYSTESDAETGRPAFSSAQHDLHLCWTFAVYLTCYVPGPRLYLCVHTVACPPQTKRRSTGS